MRRLTRDLLPGSPSALAPAFLALLVAAAGVTSAMPGAWAADLPAAPSYYPPSYHAPLYDWTGFYGGGHVGIGLLLDTVTQQSAAASAPGLTASLNPFGVVGGVQVGANYQFGPWVIGGEGTFTSSAITGSGNSPTNFAGVAEHSTSAAPWYASFAARAGYAADALLFYLKGGGAWMRVNYTQDFLGGVGGGSQTITDTRNGFVVGAGVEYGLLENLSAKFEYDFFDFGTRNYSFSIAAPPIVMPVSIKSDTHMFTVGLNYRFNWGGGHAPY